MTTRIFFLYIYDNSSTVLGCFFHYSKCLWRNFSRFDLVPEYKVLGSDIRRSFQLIKSLPFVPVDDISCAWEVLKPTILFDMADFTQYCELTWIGTSNMLEVPIHVDSQSCQVLSSMLESA